MTATATTDTVTVEIDRVFDATVERIWQMFTDPEEIRVWGCGDWYDHVEIDFDLRVGGVLHHRVTGKSDGSPWTYHGVYLEIDEDKRLVYTFDWKSDWREPHTPSTVTIEFSPTNDGTASIHLEHSDVARPGEESTSQHWNAFLEVLESLL